MNVMILFSCAAKPDDYYMESIEDLYIHYSLGNSPGRICHLTWTPDTPLLIVARPLLTATTTMAGCERVSEIPAYYDSRLIPHTGALRHVSRRGGAWE